MGYPATCDRSCICCAHHVAEEDSDRRHCIHVLDIVQHASRSTSIVYRSWCVSQDTCSSDLPAVHLIQNYVSAQRVSDFLDEEESMKNAQYSEPSGPNDPPLGCINATFTHLSEQEALAASAPATAALTADATASGLTSATFKLVDVTVSFPEEGLSIITGVSYQMDVADGSLSEAARQRSSCPSWERRLCSLAKFSCLMTMATELYHTLIPAQAWRIPSLSVPRYVLILCWYCRSHLDAMAGRRNHKGEHCLWKRIVSTISTLGDAKLSSDVVRYRAVIAACALQRDLEIMELGDETEVGEKGTTCELLHLWG